MDCLFNRKHKMLDLKGFLEIILSNPPIQYGSPLQYPFT